MSLGTSGITTAAVGTAIGSSSRDVGTLCKSTLVNKWAKGKPISYAQNTGITDAERKLCNQGFDLNSATSVSISQTITNAKNTPSWTYIHPTGGSTSPYRLGDFRGYNHNASSMFDYSSFPSTVNTYTSTANASFRIKLNNSEMDLSDFSFFENYGGLSDWKYGIAYKLSSWADADTMFAYGATASDVVNASEVIIDVTFPSAGTYTVIPVLTRETTTTSDAMETLYLPDGYRTITVSKKSSYAVITITTDLNPTYDGQYIWGLGTFITLSIVNNTSGVSVPSTSAKLSFQCYCYNSSGDDMGYFYVNPEESGQFSYSGTGTQTVNLDYLYGGYVDVSQYMDNYDDIYKMVIYADTIDVSGDGLFTFNKTYTWTIYKQ